MLQEQIRQARIDHGFSQAELARLSGVPRERLRQLELGGNVTIETIRKIVAQLPGLKTVSLGSVDVLTRGASAVQLRDTLAAWLETGRQLLTLLETVTVAEPVAPAPAPESDSRVSAAMVVTPELELRLRRLEARYQRLPKET